MKAQADIFRIETNHVVPARGRLLMAEPFMCDCMFGRAVIFMTEHGETGSMGFVLNKPFPLGLADVLPGFDALPPIPLYRGGPVCTDTLFFLHTLHELPGATPVCEGLWMNGDFDAIKRHIVEGYPVEGHLRFFLGYAGWDSGQLNDELMRNTWIIGSASIARIMAIDGMDEDLWKVEMANLGGKYGLWARFPQMPLFN